MTRSALPSFTAAALALGGCTSDPTLARSCDDNGTRRAHGESWMCDCSECRCEDGEVHGNLIDCSGGPGWGTGGTSGEGGGSATGAWSGAGPSSGAAPGTAGSAGAGASAGAGGSAGLVCDDPTCCVPLSFDTARSRVYLVDGILVVYVVAQRTDDVPARFDFEAEVTMPDASAMTCSASSVSTEGGFIAVECAPREAAEIGCGEQLALEVRLRTSASDPSTGAPLCDRTAFGPGVTWGATVACPECPGTGYAGMEPCDHPSISACGYPTSDPHCGVIDFLPCRCVLLSDGDRVWSCAVC